MHKSHNGFAGNGFNEMVGKLTDPHRVIGLAAPFKNKFDQLEKLKKQEFESWESTPNRRLRKTTALLGKPTYQDVLPNLQTCC